MPRSPVAAVDGDLNRARAKYPNIAGTRLDDCLLCHPAGSHRVNPYGQDYSRNRGNFGAIEGLDSDGDGFTNLTEILALTFPGDPNDMPAPTPTGGPTAASTPTASPTTASRPATDLRILKRVASGVLPRPGHVVTFTLAVENQGAVAAIAVVITDTLSGHILHPTWSASGALAPVTARHGPSIVWDLSDLAPGASGLITIAGQIDPTLPPGAVVVNEASIASANQDIDPADNTSHVTLAAERIYLPHTAAGGVVLRDWWVSCPFWMRAERKAAATKRCRTWPDQWARAVPAVSAHP